MSKAKSKAQGELSLMLAIMALSSVFMISAEAKTPAGKTNTEMLSGIKVTDKNIWRYEQVKLTANGKSLEAYLINSTTYVPVRAFYDAFIKSSITFSSASRTATVKNQSFSASITDGAYYIIANGRYLWTDNPIVIMNDGKMYMPVRILAKTLGVSVDWDNGSRSVAVRGAVKYIENGSTYYNSDDVYWLSRIISAESRGEPLLGQIAVGNVVMNRVRSSQYPNTIYGVIFDRKYGTQFSPVSFGTIYNTPAASSVAAAKICLEGTSISEDILFFYNSSIATTNWIDRARPFAFKIKNHKFYY